MRAVLRVSALALGLVSMSAFAPAPMASQLQVSRSSAVSADPICDEYFRCVAQCPIEDVTAWEICNNGCYDLYPCILGQ